jgi:endonuclease YncB( thermonuclease family)
MSPTSKSLRGRTLFPRRRRSAGFGRAALVILLLFFGFVFFQGRVVSVADGDTLSVLGNNARVLKVRLYGIDCPESAQPGGEGAAAFARETALFADVGLTVLDTDQYGRTVAIVRLPDGRLLNEELLRAGHAWVYRDFCREAVCAAWLLMEEEARRAGRGLWRSAGPIPPWQWRRQHR